MQQAESINRKNEHGGFLKFQNTFHDNFRFQYSIINIQFSLPLVTGFILGDEWLQVTGIILFGHSSMDRMFGYGLKLSEGFQYTHLGMIGRNQNETLNIQ